MLPVRFAALAVCVERRERGAVRFAADEIRLGRQPHRYSVKCRAVTANGEHGLGRYRTAVQLGQHGADRIQHDGGVGGEVRLVPG